MSPDLRGVAAFRIVQDSTDLARAHLVFGRIYSPYPTNRIQRGLKASLGAGIDIEVGKVSAIPLWNSGTVRYVVSRMAA